MWMYIFLYGLFHPTKYINIIIVQLINIVLYTVYDPKIPKDFIWLCIPQRAFYQNYNNTINNNF